MRKASLGRRNSGALYGACLLCALWFVVLGIVGTPRMILYMLSSRGWLIPSWLLLLLTTLYYVFGGLAVGSVLARHRCPSGVHAYRGSFFFSIGVALSCLWYALFFGAGYFFIATWLSLISWICLVIAALNFRVFSCFAVKTIWISIGISAYFLIISIFSFFCL